MNFSSSMRKLKRASTCVPPPPPPVPVDRPVPAKSRREFVQQQVQESFPTSYMPNDAPVRVDSLLAVHLSLRRCEELGLKGFQKYEPLLAKVVRVVNDGHYECLFLESQPVRGQPHVDGLSEGYRGRWDLWRLDDGTVPSPVLLKEDDIYCSNFKLIPKSDILCNSLKLRLHKSLKAFKESFPDAP